MFLTDAQLQALTGYVRPSHQLRWLRAHGIEPYVNARGHVQVTCDAVEAVLRQRSKLDPATPKRRGIRPNFAAVS